MGDIEKKRQEWNRASWSRLSAKQRQESLEELFARFEYYAAAFAANRDTQTQREH